MVATARPTLDATAIARLTAQIRRGLDNAERQNIADAIQKIAGNAYSIPSGTEADRIYFVVFKDRGVIPNYDVSCNCTAGLNGTMCKHVATALVAHRRVAPDGTILARL